MTTESVEPADSDGTPREGDIVAGKYRIERVLGKGGMGVVVAAEHTVLRQKVAIKFLLPEAMKRAGAAERFQREARAASAIQNEHIARVTDVGVLESGAPYMVMEYLTGKDLGEVIRERGKLPIPEAVDYLLQACEAIAEAHALGIIHRDLKPANLFVTTRPDGTPLVKVLDFGLSKVTKGELLEASLTAANVVMGSPFYMSPEQVRSLKGIDSRSDIWSLGVILYQLVSGTRPFDTESLGSLFLAIGADPAPTLRSRLPTVPPGLEAAIMKCLEKEVPQRVRSVGELARAIAPFGSEDSRFSVERILRLLPDGTPLPRRMSDAEISGMMGLAELTGPEPGVAPSMPPPASPSMRPAPWDPRAPADSGSMRATTGEGMSNTLGNVRETGSVPTSRAPSFGGRRMAVLVLGAAAVVGVAGGLAAVKFRSSGQPTNGQAQAVIAPVSASAPVEPAPAATPAQAPTQVAPTQAASAVEPPVPASASAPAVASAAPSPPASASAKAGAKAPKPKAPVKKSKDPLERWK